MRVIVVGAGIIGAAVSEALAVRGAEVVMLEMRSPGQGASQASAGMLAPYTEAAGHPVLLELGVRSLALFEPLFARLEDRTGRRIERGQPGTLEVALGADDGDRLRGLLPVLGRGGARAEWWDAAAVADREPSLTTDIAGGLYVADHGFVAVRDLLHAYLDSARWAGALLVSPVEAATVEPRRDGVAVRASSRSFDGDAVVLAGGSWSSRIKVAKIRSLPVKPVRGQLLHLRTVSDARPSRVVWGPRCYTVPWSDGSLLVGATMEDVGFDEHATVAGVQKLTSAIAELVPAAAGAQVESIRVGLRPALPDHLPAVGPFAETPRVVAATGHFRNGVLLAPLTAEVVSRFLLDGVRDPSFDLTSPDREWTDHGNA